MGVDLNFEVIEVGFDEFERRKMPRANVSLIEIQNKTFLTSVFDAAEATQAEFDLGMEIHEVPFNQFERRKHPR